MIHRPPLPLTFHFRNVIWLADTNYRIELENDRVRQLALADDFDALLSADQVGSLLQRECCTDKDA